MNEGSITEMNKCGNKSELFGQTHIPLEDQKRLFRDRNTRRYSVNLLNAESLAAGRHLTLSSYTLYIADIWNGGAVIIAGATCIEGGPCVDTFPASTSRFHLTHSVPSV